MKRRRDSRPQPESPYDQALANTASAVDHCMKMGAVVLKPSGSRPAGFQPPQRDAEPGRTQ
jgi:hypothetical protein